jgi:nucleotide-binding universal stress UspA family protein
MKIEKILIVADDSPTSLKAVQYGFNLARDAGASVMLLNVIEAESVAGNPDAGIFHDDALMATKTRADDFLKRMKSAYGQSVETEICTTVGEVMPTIIKTIADWNASLVVAGTHGRTGLSKLFSGSIAESIIHHSPIPVCVVPLGNKG